MTKLISVFVLLFICHWSAAAPADPVHHIQNDTLKVNSRSFDKKTIEEFKADADFQFSRPREGLTTWERVVIWLSMVLLRILHYLTGTAVGQLIFYGVCAAIIVYVVLKLLNIDVRDLFYRTSASSKNNFSLAEENIHGLDFEKLIEKAVEKKEYRNAVRLIFLFSLKKLSDAELIRWMPGKTNDEYLTELKQHPTRPRLQELRYYFDYAWYGHFEITDQTFDSVQQTFREFNNHLL